MSNCPENRCQICWNDDIDSLAKADGLCERHWEEMESLL